MDSITNIRCALQRISLILTSLAVTSALLGQAAAEPAYDVNSTIEVRGTIATAKAVPGGNTVVQLDAADGNGQVLRWTVTLGRVSELRSAGITHLSLAPGLPLVVTGNPSIHASEPGILAQKVTCSDGSVWTRPNG